MEQKPVIYFELTIGGLDEVSKRFEEFLKVDQAANILDSLPSEPEVGMHNVIHKRFTFLRTTNCCKCEGGSYRIIT